MFTTEDYLKLSPWDALIEIINQRYQLELDSARAKLVEFTPGVGTKTSVRISSPRSSAVGNLLPPFNDRTFSYDRLDLSTHFGITPIVIADVRPPISSFTLVQKWSALTGVKFGTEDFVNEIITTDAELANYELTAHPRSLRWVGSVTLRGQASKVALSSLGVTSAPSAITYTQNNAAKVDGTHYLMPYDFSAYRDELLPVRIGNLTLPPKRLAAILAAVTQGGENWVCQDMPAAFNLAADIVSGVPCYRVLYSGKVTNRWSPRTDMRYVLVLELDAARCTNMGGHLLIHFK